MRGYWLRRTAARRSAPVETGPLSLFLFSKLSSGVHCPQPRYSHVAPHSFASLLCPSEVSNPNFFSARRRSMGTL